MNSITNFILEETVEGVSISNEKKTNYVRALIAYFIFGICNNYGYVVILSGAQDIISEMEKTYVEQNDRNCTYLSIGVTFLADILPGFTTKLIFPFLPPCIHLRMSLFVGFAILGMFLVAFGTVKWVTISGVVTTSFTSGLCEVTLLKYSVYFDKNVISTWSSGTGFAGILGSLSYILFSMISPRVAMLSGLVLPVIMAVTFWKILPKPDPDNELVILKQNRNIKHENYSLKNNISVKLKLLPGLAKYMVPLSSIFFFQYLMNQSLYELIYYENILVDHAFQYKCLQIIYQIPVFISRSSVNILEIKKIWIMSLLQFVNLIILTFESIYYFIPSLWIVFLITFWEGLLAGSSYVNTFYRISQEVEAEQRAFSMSMTTLSDAFGIMLAGMLAIPVHNAICKLEKPERITFS